MTQENLIKKYSSAIIKALMARVEAIRYLDNKQKKGELIEIFVENCLKCFLTSQFGIGTGFIINHKGDQSCQTDIIIYDNRVIPPFIKEEKLGVYPAESVLNTIEIKSELTKKELLKSERKAEYLHNIYPTKIGKYSTPADYVYVEPLYAVIGFYGKGVKELNDKQGIEWLKKNVKYISAICLVNKFSWINIMNRGWVFCPYNKETNEETKRFIAVILDNARTISERREIMFKQIDHRDWLSKYIRDQK